MDFWRNKRVLVTGGAGFIGSHLVEMLVDKGAKVSVADNLENGKLENLKAVEGNVKFEKLDLKNIENCIRATKNIDVVFNLAAKMGGVGFNKAHPGTMFYNNIMIDANTLEAARLNNVKRFLVCSSACVYPRLCKVPTPESEGFRSIPEPTNSGYGWAKRMAEFHGRAYACEFGMEIVLARPCNTYGPHDHFNPEISHVIPSLIKRIFDGEDPLIIWGDGEQSRAFIYVTDCARGLLEMAEKYAVADPVNLGTDEEIKIKDLAELIVKLSNRSPGLYFDTTRPCGYPRRNSDNTKAKEKAGFTAQMELAEGLKRTIEWYKQAMKI
jgi:GDP-L-fucose synthase